MTFHELLDELPPEILEEALYREPRSICNLHKSEWICTRNPDHFGYHLAGGSETIYAIWDDDGEYLERRR